MAKRAALGFKYLSLEKELTVSTEEDFEREDEERKLNSHNLTKASKLRCYHKHAKEYNKAKRAVAQRIDGRFKDAVRGARKRGVGWKFTQDEWEHAWMEAGWIRIPGTQSVANPNGDVVPAFAIRGSHAYNNTCMKRINLDKPWGIDNYKIMYRGVEVGPDNKWSVMNYEPQQQ